MNTLMIGTLLVLTLAMMNWIVLKEFCATPPKQVRKRLQNYAVMHDGKEENSEDCQDSPPSSLEEAELLTGKQHKILLGILKKVEAKNSTLARVYTFLGAPCIALAANPKIGSYSQLALLAVAYVGVFLFSAIRGMHQLDQMSSLNLSAKQMQDDLIKDMLIKEAELRFCLFGANFGLFLMGISVPVILLMTS